ncbi:MAG: sugar ABC transporter substrate-binding protein [Candidatus Limiplasma sp.]|nr:sugar ABC transporter substrate-binding protein [Candidatus Limiplasma sp.]
MKKFVSLLLAVALCCVAVFGAVAETAVAPRTYNFVFIVKSMQFSFMLSMIDGANAAAKLVDNINIVCEGPETPYSVAEQIELVEQAITNGVDAILITPADSTGIIPAIEAANAAGIPIATPNTKAYGGNVLTWVGVDNYTVGYQLGKALCDALSGKGDVVLIEGTAGNSTSTERVDGYKAAFSEYPDIKLLDSQPADFNREKGMTVMENFLERYDHIDGVASVNKDMTMGALEAVKSAGREDEMIQVTFDVDNDCLDAIEAGEILLTGAQEEKSQVANCIYACMLACNGYKVAPQQVIPMTLVTKDNISLYR